MLGECPSKTETMENGRGVVGDLREGSLSQGVRRDMV